MSAWLLYTAGAALVCATPLARWPWGLTLVLAGVFTLLAALIVAVNARHAA